MFIKSARWSELFAAAFIVGAAFDAVFAIFGLALAILSPGNFHTTNLGAVSAAASPAQAVGILFLIIIFLLIANLIVAATGAGGVVIGRLVWMRLRRR